MRKTLIKAMVLSIVMIFSAITVLFTTTYAWFTDNQQADNNTITAGTLDIAVTALKADGTEIDLSSDKIINEVNWKPSDSDVVAIVISNNGSIDFKYDLNLTVEDTEPVVNLAPVIWYQFTADAENPTAVTPYIAIEEPAAPVFFNAFTPITGQVLTAYHSITYRLDYGFLEEAGNEYQAGLLKIGINVQAYQIV